MRAKEAGNSEADIDCTNHWKMVEQAKGSKPNLPIWDHNTQVGQLKKSRLRDWEALWMTRYKMSKFCHLLNRELPGTILGGTLK